MFQPTQLQLALAIAIVRSRPEDLTIREYALLLKTHSKHGRQPLDDPRHIDQIALWRARCLKLESNLREQQADFVQLLHKTSLEKQLPVVNDEAQHRPKRIRHSKRHHDGTIVSVTDYAPNKSKSILGQHTSLGVLQNSSQGTAVLAHLYHLDHSHSQTTDGSQQQYSRLVDCAQSLHHLTHCVLQQKDQSSLDRYLLALSRAWTALLCKCTLDPSDQSFPTTRNSIAYHFTSSFSAILANLETTASSSPDSTITRAHITALTKFLSTIPRSPHLHASLAEGTAYLILRSIGKLLFASTFGHADKVDTAATIREAATSSSPTVSEQVTPTVASLAPHLISLLRQSLDVVVAGSCDADRLDISLREKMQETLLACVFGREKEATAEIFRAPDPLPPQARTKDCSDDDDHGLPLTTADDFVQALWSVLGWDVLSSKTCTL